MNNNYVKITFPNHYWMFSYLSFNNFVFVNIVKTNLNLNIVLQGIIQVLQLKFY